MERLLLYLIAWLRENKEEFDKENFTFHLKAYERIFKSVKKNFSKALKFVFKNEEYYD